MELHKIITISCFFSGIICLLVSILGFRRDRYIKTKGIFAQAEIVEIKRGGGKLKPVAEYYNNDGIIISAKSFYSGSGIFFNYKVGDKKNIFYDKNKQKSFRFEDDKSGTILWGILFFCGIVDFIIPYFISLILI